MKKYCFLALILSVTTLVQGRPVLERIKITIHRSASKKVPVIKLTSVDMISFKPLPVPHTTQLSFQSTVLQLPIGQPGFISLDIDGTYNLLYLAPGDDLHIYVNDFPAKQVIRFKGRGAQVNLYLAQATAIRLRSEQPRGKMYSSLSIQEFVSHLKAVEQAYQHLNHTYLAKANLSSSLKDLLVERNQINLLFMKQNYVLVHEDGPTDPLSTSLKDATAVIPFNARFLSSSMPEYAMVANMYVGYLLPRRLSTQAATTDQMPLFIERSILTSAHSPQLKEYLLAKNCYNWLEISGLTLNIKSLFTRYKTQFAHSNYLPEVNQLYQKWLVLSPGQPAPNFYGVTPKGDTATLSSLRGKVIYVDVWATWCVPCRAEFPQAKTLQARFANNSKVAFMYVSVDQDQAAWKKFLQSDPDFGGIHLNQASESQAGSLWKPYMLSGIPRYILIDQKGLLVDVNAAKPSSGTIADSIDMLLK